MQASFCKLSKLHTKMHFIKKNEVQVLGGFNVLLTFFFHIKINK